MRASTALRLEARLIPDGFEAETMPLELFLLVTGTEGEVAAVPKEIFE